MKFPAIPLLWLGFANTFTASSAQILTFCVIADVPYTDREANQLPGQIKTQMDGCEFLVHLGDIYKLGDTQCTRDRYKTVRNILRKHSPIPAFVMTGDNEWNDCKSVDAAWKWWTDHFLQFENNWDHTLNVIRQPDYKENFYFIHNRALIVGLKIVGGRVHNQKEWTARHRSEFLWVRDIIQRNVLDRSVADSVVLMAHAHPKQKHKDFFHKFANFMQTEMRNEVPVLYMHGDGHRWVHTPNYFNQSNFVRIQHRGGTNDPVLKISVTASETKWNRAFRYDRQLKLKQA